MTQVSPITAKNDSNLNTENSVDFEKREEIIRSLVEQGLPRAFSPSNFINKIAQNNDISTQEARECLKEAIEQLEARNKEKVTKSYSGEEKAYAQSGYFYPRENNINTAVKNDGMDSLVAFSNFQRLRFGLQ